MLLVRPHHGLYCAEAPTAQNCPQHIVSKATATNLFASTLPILYTRQRHRRVPWRHERRGGGGDGDAGGCCS